MRVCFKEEENRETDTRRERGRGREKEITRFERICLANFPIKLQYIFLQKLLIFFLHSIVVEVEKVIHFHILDIHIYFVQAILITCLKTVFDIIRSYSSVESN